MNTALILAGGESQRMGLPKALLALRRGTSFLEHLGQLMAKAGYQVRVVTGAHAQPIAEVHPEWVLWPNRGWRAGQYSSIRRGLRGALAEGAQTILIHPVDLPLIRLATLRSLERALGEHDAAVPLYQGRPGHPLLLTARAARRVLRMSKVPHMEAALHHLSVAHCDTRDRGVVTNLNSPGSYRRALGVAPRAVHRSGARLKREVQKR